MLALPGNFFEALPGINLQILSQVMAPFMLATLRISSFLISSPIFAIRGLPLQVRIVMSICISLAVASTVSIPDIGEIVGAQLAIIAFSEIAIGLVAGLILYIMFSAAALAGEKMAATGGLGFASLLDPETGAQSPVLAQLLSLFILVAFISLDGHLIVLRTILQSYYILPIGGRLHFDELIETGISAGSLMFRFAALIMLPVVVGLTLINVLIGVITRSAPTLNLFSFGFPITLMGSFFILYISADHIAYSFANLIDVASGLLIDLFESISDG